ncbi:hypothetical protein bmyco0003_49930 [Bacillus pseudomycoides]|nr:hypothetical protein bmyco0003_49930 [Bacillus pseudomycoides]
MNESCFIGFPLYTGSILPDTLNKIVRKDSKELKDNKIMGMKISKDRKENPED